jgi:hypothetical protein
MGEVRMKITKVVLPALLMAASVHITEAAESGTWTVGPNVGFSVLSSGGESLTSFGLPNGGGLLAGSVQPGLRIGFVAPGGQYDVYLDTGLNVLSGGGETIHSLLGTFNFQYNFSPVVATTPYVTAGAGFARVGGGGDSETNGLFGGGFGVRHRISDGHGALRGEARYDRLRLSDGANGFGVKLGVDLWIP